MRRSLRTITTISSASLEVCDKSGTTHSDASRINGGAENTPHPLTFETGSEVATRKNLGGYSTMTTQETLRVPKKQAHTRQTLRQYKSVMEHLFGTVYTRSKTSLLQSSERGGLTDLSQLDHCEHENSLEIRPAGWLVNLGVKYGLRLDLLRSPIRGWEQKLKPFYLVPDNALIFEFCTQGNIPAVRTLLAKGDASVRDTDSKGRTALHVSLKPQRFCLIVGFLSVMPNARPSLPRKASIQNSANSS